MNDLSLFHDKAPFRIGKKIYCLSDRKEDVLAVIRNNPYPMLFVLQGQLEVHFKMGCHRIGQGELAVVASKEVMDCELSSPLALMIYYPSDRLAGYLGMSSKMFRLSISEILPIQPSLQEWIDKQLRLTACASEAAASRPTDGDERQKCAELVRILITYPRNAIETLYMPLYACSIGHCKHCGIEIE